MTLNDRIEQFVEVYGEYPGDNIYLADGFDEAFLGVAYDGHCAIYDAQKCIDILMTQDMDEEEAREYFDFNVVGSHLGPGTPQFITTMEKDDE